MSWVVAMGWGKLMPTIVGSASGRNDRETMRRLFRQWRDIVGLLDAI
jgi:hypothetical protein